MATVTEPEATPEAVESLPRDYPPHRLTIQRYERMVKAGLFGEKEPIFLWHGRLAEKMTKGRPHALVLIKLNAILIRLVPVGWYIQPEQPIAIEDDGLPEPDLAVVRGAADDHGDRAPGPRDLGLVVEIADSSLSVDSGAVLETYAAQRIPIYWIVNIPKRRVEAYRDPTGPADSPSYRECRQYRPGEQVPVVLDGVEVGAVAVADFLP